MTDTPLPPPAAAVAAATTTKKYESESLDFWHGLCRKFDDNKAKYKYICSNFLAHEDSGPDVSNTNSYKQKMSRNLKKYKAGKLKENNGDKKRNRKSAFPLLEAELLAALDRLKAANEPTPSWAGKSLIVNDIARNLGKEFKAKRGWANGVLKRRRTTESTDDSAYSTPTQAGVTTSPNMTVASATPTQVTSPQHMSISPISQQDLLRWPICLLSIVISTRTWSVICVP